MVGMRIDVVVPADSGMVTLRVIAPDAESPIEISMKAQHARILASHLIRVVGMPRDKESLLQLPGLTGATVCGVE